MATCSVPPYCGRVSAVAAAIITLPTMPANMLLTTSDRQSKRLIAPCLSISLHSDRRIAPRFGPQSGDRPGEIHSRAHPHRIAIRKLIRTNRIPPPISGPRSQHLPARAARSLHARHFAAPVEPAALIADAVDEMCVPVGVGEQPQHILLSR